MARTGTPTRVAELVRLAWQVLLSRPGIGVYLMADGEQQRLLLSKPGKHKMGKSCLYFKQLVDLDQSTFEKLVIGSITELQRRYAVTSPTPPAATGKS